MLSKYFINLLLLVSVTFVGGHILKDISNRKSKTMLFKVLSGLFCGLFGVLMIIYSVPIKEANTLVDLRLYAVMIASLVGGIIPSIISGIVIILYRIIFYESHIAVLVAAVQIASFIVLYEIIDRLTKDHKKRWVYKTITSMAVVLVTYYFLLCKIENVFMILLQYAFMLVVAGILEFILIDYVKTTNELYKKYKNDSTKDFLTGLTNTRQFDIKLNMAMERVQINKEKLSCLMVDIDFFKKINDTYGHLIGDLVLKELAEVLKKSIRSSDIIARVGGEEFCALLFGCNREQSFEIALNINKAVQKHQFPIGDNQFIQITVSVGLSIYPDMTDNLETLKELADTALYTAKRSGRNRVCDHDRCMTSEDIL